MSNSKVFRPSPSSAQVGLPIFDNGISRRNLLKFAGAVGGASLLAACGAGSSSSATTFTL